MAPPYLQFPVPYLKIDLDEQSLEVPGTKRAGQTAHYRNASLPFVGLDSPGTVKNLQEVFENGLYYGGPDAPCLGQRTLISKEPLRWADSLEWQSYGTVDARRRAIGSGIYKLFRDGVVGGGTLQTVGIWSRNVANWQLIDLSLHLFNLVNVALYDTLGRDSVEHVINHAETSIVFASTQNIPTLLQLSHRTPCLKVIVVIEELEEEAKCILTMWARSHNVKLMEFSEIEALGQAHPCKPLPASSDAIATICYTSGTTGVPKGVVLTQGSLAIGAHALLYGGKFDGEPVVEFSYLPLAHIFERVVQLSVFVSGGSVGFGTGDPLRLIEDMQLVKPTILVSVPRVMNRIVAAAMAASKAPGLKGTLFNYALATKLANFRKNGETKHVLWDRLIFSKIQAILGGKLKMLGLGSAPMHPVGLEFLKISLGCQVIEGYGSTENCGAGGRAVAFDPTSAGTVGPPGISMEWKLVNVPALDYSSEDKPNPRGEICTRGATQFTGYFKDETNTKAAIDKEGWFHTGDVGELDSKGRFKIIDRVKNIMKLAQGEYVAVERIETMYSASPVVAQLYVHGDSLQSYLVAVLVPDPVQLASIASIVLKARVVPDDHGRLGQAIADPQVVDALFTELAKEGNKNDLKGYEHIVPVYPTVRSQARRFEKIKRIHVTLDLCTVEEGTLTPTLKIRRKDAYNKWKGAIDAMYKLPEPTTRALL
ncbi:hypothetical protein EUX98_g4475 [Antrodiella citrinella]|uniref:AMP-dependent synthetase/ligase domain-containing protein n=1 Tax=Antrodiella citrinella TaxID=2447956 RepID=A0A4S4MUU0_9APHY|nr:hypothetical protein EUX98_g4475 [Antrodiella citrinella]